MSFSLHVRPAPRSRSDGWYWRLVVPALAEHGHDVVAVICPVTTPSAGWPSTPSTVVDAIGDAAGRPTGVVAQSLGGFTASLVCERVPVELMVLVAAMVPNRVSPGEWWANTGQTRPPAPGRDRGRRSRREDDRCSCTTCRPTSSPNRRRTCATSRVRRSRSRGRSTRGPTCRPGSCSVPRRPVLPRRVQRRVVRERLGFDPDEMDSGHLPALAHPVDLADRLLAYVQLTRAVGRPAVTARAGTRGCTMSCTAEAPLGEGGGGHEVASRVRRRGGVDDGANSRAACTPRPAAERGQGRAGAPPSLHAVGDLQRCRTLQRRPSIPSGQHREGVGSDREWRSA